MDCNSFINYQLEKQRMTNGCSINCEKCVLGRVASKFDISCKELELFKPALSLMMVQSWSNQHEVICKKLEENQRKDDKHNG